MSAILSCPYAAAAFLYASLQQPGIALLYLGTANIFITVEIQGLSCLYVLYPAVSPNRQSRPGNHITIRSKLLLLRLVIITEHCKSDCSVSPLLPYSSVN